MKLWDIIKNVGTGIIKEVVPGGGLLVGAINELLPDDKQLPDSATGEDVKTAISKLTPAQQASIMEKEFDVDITQIKESNVTLRAMLEADTKNPQTTRPYIAKHSFHVIAIAVMFAILMWSYGVLIKDKDLVEAVMDGWPFILSVIGPFVTLLWAYFGVLKQEHRGRLNAAQGKETPSIVSTLLSVIRGK
jgi:hypothetical protein